MMHLCCMYMHIYLHLSVSQCKKTYLQTCAPSEAKRQISPRMILESQGCKVSSDWSDCADAESSLVRILDSVRLVSHVWRYVFSRCGRYIILFLTPNIFGVSMNCLQFCQRNCLATSFRTLVWLFLFWEVRKNIGSCDYKMVDVSDLRSKL